VQRNAQLDSKWWILVTVGVGTFMSALDASAVNTVLPVMNRSLGSQITTIEWVVTIYLLVVSGILLAFGRLGDMYGHKPIYVTGFIVFVLSSALCGISPSALFLIGFRALQAVGAAMLFANSPAILTKAFPADQRGQALGVQASITYLGLTVGPSLGGWLTTISSWRAVFYINVPVGVIALLLSLRFVPRDALSQHHDGFDWAGAGTWMCGLSMLVLALNRGPAWGWPSPRVYGLLAAGGLFLALFIFMERRVRAPMLDLSLFQRRAFSAAIATAVLNFISVYSMVFLLPFYLIQGRSMSSAKAGLLLTSHSVVRAVVSPVSGTLSDKVGARLPAALGMGVLGAALFLLSRLGAESGTGQIAVGLAIAGVGTGLFLSPNSSALMGSAPRHQQGIAAATLATARTVGMVLGVGLAGAIFATVSASGGSMPSTAGLIRAVDSGLLVASGAAVLGILTAAVGGTHE
jgi:EmrB/QacA subfamily drug resistance transporter